MKESPPSSNPLQSQIFAPLRRFRSAVNVETDFRRWLGLTLLGLVTASIVFTLYTGNIWEDYLITLRFSQNLVEGHGLVYHVGERVHGFTSVINTLLPAVFLWLGDIENYQGALAGYRAVSILTLLGGCCVLFYALQRDGRLDAASRWFLTGLLLLDFKLIAFTCNGMETGFLIGFLMVALAVSLRGVCDYWLVAGLAWGGLLYTRPDTPLLIAGLSGFALFLHREQRRHEFRGLLKAATVCTVLYLPWFLWAWAYYGSPVPHTIVAKAAHGSAPTHHTWFTAINGLWAQLPYINTRAFLPIYAAPQDWWWPGAVAALLACGVATTAWLWFTRDRVAQALSLLAFLYVCYLAFQNAQRLAYPWYFPPATLLASLVLARMLSAWSNGRTRSVHRTIAGALLVLLVFNWGFGLRSIKIQQSESENGVRMQVGLWLREHVKSPETVFLEPLGYIGYFSRAQMLDFPGLVSPRAVSAVKATTGDMPSVAEYLKPDWMVLRPIEAKSILSRPAMADGYELVAVQSGIDQLAKYGTFVGSNYAYSDIAFFIFRRKSPSEPATHQ